MRPTGWRAYFGQVPERATESHFTGAGGRHRRSHHSHDAEGRHALEYPNDGGQPEGERRDGAADLEEA